MKKKRLTKSFLYVIIDKESAKNRSLITIAKQLKASEADIIQLRDKISKKADILRNAFLINKLFSGTNKIFLVNDYLDIAKITGCDGIHLGQLDTSVKIARRILGKEKIIGASCHSLKQALRAEREGADYIGIGPIFKTPTKPECKAVGLKLIREVKLKISIPFFAIGGINEFTVNAVKTSGAKRVAVCKAILKNKDITSKVRYLYDAIRIRQK